MSTLSPSSKRPISQKRTILNLNCFLYLRDKEENRFLKTSLTGRSYMRSVHLSWPSSLVKRILWSFCEGWILINNCQKWQFRFENGNFGIKPRFFDICDLFLYLEERAGTVRLSLRAPYPPTTPGLKRVPLYSVYC